MLIHVGVIVLLLVQGTYVVSLSLCNRWNYLEIKERRDDNTFTCSGLSDQQTVQWLFDTTKIGSCPAPPTSCTKLVNGPFDFSRTTSSSSTITILATQLSDLSDLGKNISCQTTAESVICKLDLVYPAENAMCQIQFSAETWAVTGWCSVPKLLSTNYLNNSGCYLYQTSEDSSTSKQIGYYKMDLKNASPQSGYYTGTCNMTSELPPNGSYSYTVIILPGEVNTSAIFNGSNEIRKPEETPTHNCPQFLKEGDLLNCTCSSHDFGSPAGTLAWIKTGSNKLILVNQTRQNHGESYVCSLTWNRTALKSVTYTLTIAYPPTQPIFTMNNKENGTVTVEENTTVTLLCRSDGRPTPNMTITNVTNGKSIAESLSKGNISEKEPTQKELRHNITMVQCETSGEYRCAASNDVGSTDKSVQLFIKCKPRRVPPQSNSSVPTIFEGKSESFELIAYPTSVNLTKYHLGPNITSDEGPASDETFSAECKSIAGVVYKITCTVTVNRVTPDTADYYKLRVSNGLGEVELIFQAKPRDTTTTASPINSSDESPAGIIAGAVVGGILVIGLVTIAVILLLRRKGRKNSNKPMSKTTAKSSKEDKDEVLTTNAIYDSSDNQPLASKQTVRPSDCGAVLSMSPVAESAYENAAFSGETAMKGKKKGNGAKEAKRRNEQGLLYTTVVFSNAPASQKSAPPQPEPTEYATIRQASAQQ